MDQRRKKLHQILVETLGSTNVYHNATENTRMQYPAIEYHLDRISSQHGGDLPYALMNRYMVTLITRSANDPTVAKLARLRSSLYDRSFTQDGLYHTIFNITY